MTSYRDIFDGVCDLLGLNPAEIGATRAAALQRAISTAIQLVWGMGWWPGTVVRRHMNPGITYPGPLWRGVLTYHADSGRWYQYLETRYRSDPPAVYVGGEWRANLPVWTEYQPVAAAWERSRDYSAGSRVKYGGRTYAASEPVTAGNAPGGSTAESAKWIPVPTPAPFVYVHQFPYPPVGRVRGLWRRRGGWEAMQWSDPTDGGLLFVIGYEDEQYGWRVYEEYADPADYRDAVLEYQVRFPELTGTVYDPAQAYRPPHWPLLPEAPQPQVVKPVILPGTTAFETNVTVTISTSTPGATIHYTLDGSTPTTSSPVYTDPLVLSATTTVKAFAVKAGLLDSEVATRTYTKSAQVYWGASDQTVLDEAGILGLGNSAAKVSPAGTYAFGANDPPKYLYLSWPNAGPQPVPVTGFMSGGLPMTGDLAGADEGYDQVHNGWPYRLVTVNGQAYRLYRTKYLMSAAIYITVNV